MSRDINIINNVSSGGYRARGDWLGGFIFLGVLCLFSKAIIIGVVTAIVTWVLLRVGQGLFDMHYARKAHNDELRRRADRENAEYLRDGYYEGQYPAETIPTGWSQMYTGNGNGRMHIDGQPREWYDYDDGLDKWK